MNIKSLRKIKISQNTKVLLMVAGVLLSIGFVEKKQSNRICNRIMIDVDNQYENFFIDEKDVLRLMTETGKDFIKGSAYKQIDLGVLENRIKKHKFVRNAEVYRDLQGNILVEAVQCRPLARIIRPNAFDAYISEEGNILPISDQYTSRVLLLSGALADTLVTRDLPNYKQGKKLHEFLQFINQDPFWKAQIAQVDIELDGEATFYTAVSKQLVEFGTVDNYQDKFRRLDFFYKTILPEKNWNSYIRVSLKFENQIVCE